MPAIWLQPFDVVASLQAASKRRFHRIGEKAVQRRDDLRALADRAAHALDRARTDVADGEHAGHRGFQRRDLPSEIELGLRAGDDEAAAVERDAAAIEPAGRGIGADEQKEIAAVEGALLGRQPALPAHALERGVRRTLEPDDFRIEYQFDVRCRLDALDQIARHAGAEAAAADHHEDLARVAGQEHGGLSRRIAATDQYDILAGAEPRLDRRGPVPDAAALEPV